MIKNLLIATALLVPAFAAQAQSTPAKKALAARILKVQQAQIEGLAQAMAERPALAVLDAAARALVDKVASDKREAIGKEIQSDVKKYLDEAVPVVRERALKMAPQTVGLILEDKFTEDELQQLATFLESPVSAKYVQMGPEMQKALLEKLLAETRGVIEPKVAALDQAVAKRLGITASPKGASSSAAPAK